MFIGWKDLRFAKGRFALMAAVVVLLTMLVGMLSGLTAGLANASTSAITGLSADRIAFAAPKGGDSPSFAESSVDKRQVHGLSKAQGVRSAEPLGINTTRAVGDTTASVSAFGVDPGSGLGPDGIKRGKVVLSTEAADDLGTATGQTVKFGDKQLRVAKVAGEDSYSHTPVAWLSLADWQELAPGAYASVAALSTDDDADLAAADKGQHTKTVSRSDALSAIGSYTSENGSLRMIRGFLFAIAALVIGAFFTVWTIQRSRDIAVLKALGATTGYLLRDALGQALVLLVGGAAIGTGIAAGIGAAAGSAVPFVLSVGTVVVPALVLIVLGLLGAGLAVRRITAIDPLAALANR